MPSSLLGTDYQPQRTKQKSMADLLRDNVSPEFNVFQQAEAKYPRFKKAGLAYTKSPNDGSGRIIEAWDEGDKGGFKMGGETRYRPEELPLDQRGIEDFSDKTTPLDLYGDYASHYGVNEDGDLRDKYLEFSGDVPMETMQKRYGHAQAEAAKYGEKVAPFDVWNSRSGMPEFFRGLTFKQWENAREMYTPKQIKQLEGIQDLLEIERD